MANERARYLRKSMSDPEALLWSRLRGKQLDGFRFRRQHPIGPYIADFVCLEQRLVVEVDGGQHGDPEQAAIDAQRTDWLQREGYRVIRFWSAEVFANTSEVLDRILADLNRRF
jgi:very-short-patch-repair endonuclease